MLGKIDVTDILRDHFRTLVIHGTSKTSRGDVLLFFGAPATLAAAACYYGVRLTDTAVAVLITAVSVLAGLLFNVLVLIHTIADRFNPPTGMKEGRQFLQQIYSNIGYAILISLVALLPLTLLVITPRPGLDLVLNIASWYLTAHLLLTLLMILKRLHALLKLELGKPRQPENE